MTKKQSLGPVPRFELKPWSDETKTAWALQGSRAEAVSTGAGVGRSFQQLLDEARRLLEDGDVETIRQRLGEQRFDRALITLWLNDETLAQTTMSAVVMAALSAGKRLSRLTVIIAVTLLLKHFDRLDGWRDGLFYEMSGLIRRAVAGPNPGQNPHAVDALRSLDGYLFEIEGPRQLAHHLLTTRTDFMQWLTANQLSAHADSRFGRLVRDAYYLQLIDGADAKDENHPFLEAVTSDVLANQHTDQDRLLFGHQVLTALTGKTTKNPSTSWIDAVLKLGGDPRLQRTTQWQRWWTKVPDENVRRAIRWMQALDLQAFLDGVADYAKTTGNEKMTRMLARRQRLLLGLYEQDLVEDVRLILGSDIRRYIERSAKFDLFEVARLRDSSKQDTAIVYLNCGSFCIIEGSHNFSIHVFIGGPLERLANPRNGWFEAAALRDEIPFRHKQQHGEDSHLSVIHQGFEWVRKTLDFIRDHGIEVDEHDLMSPTDRVELARRRDNDRSFGWH